MEEVVPGEERRQFPCQGTAVDQASRGEKGTFMPWMKLV